MFFDKVQSDEFTPDEYETPFRVLSDKTSDQIMSVFRDAVGEARTIAENFENGFDDPRDYPGYVQRLGDRTDYVKTPYEFLLQELETMFEHVKQELTTLQGHQHDWSPMEDTETGQLLQPYCRICGQKSC